MLFICQRGNVKQKIFHLYFDKAKVIFFIVVQAVRRIISGQSVSKIIIIILSVIVATFQDKNTDPRGKGTCAIFCLPVQK